MFEGPPRRGVRERRGSGSKEHMRFDRRRTEDGEEYYE